MTAALDHSDDVDNCPACDAEERAFAEPASEQRTDSDILADIRDLIAVIDKQEPAWRFVRTQRLRDVIDGIAR